ncbi:MAG: NAD(P)/FAD-dependent oxidoreductase [Methanomassiliicoccaceae archaeon]|nr:NAD(P)/FAD-dependent oxidoreductase [Methanomassiliicoccaceae archaeon]
MIRHDVIVVGGGPVGNRVASLLAKEYDVLVMEEHSVPGRPMQCTGLISDKVVELSGVKPTILNRLYGANVFLPNGQSIKIRSKEHKGVLIDRSEFDALMASKAEDDGAKHMYSSRFLSHSIRNGSVIAETDKTTIEASMIVGADGHNSVLARTIDNNRPLEYVRGIQADIKHRAEDQDMVNIRTGSETAPGFFSWEIPFGDMTRVGLCTSWSAGPPSVYLKALMKRTGLEDKEIVNKYCGRIPIGGQRRTYADHLLLVGDAACQVKPVSGGGLHPAFLSSYAVAETVAEAFDDNDFSEGSLSVYEKRWKRAAGKELRRGYILRKMYTTMKDNELNRAVDIFSNDDMKNVLGNADIDRPSDLLFRLMKDPKAMMRLMPIMTKAMLRSIL